MAILNPAGLASAYRELALQLSRLQGEHDELAVIVVNLQDTPFMYRLSAEQQSRLEREVESRLRNAVRSGDRVFSLGGGEWALILPRLRSRAVLPLAMLKIDRVFAESVIDIDGFQIEVNLICGAAVAPEHGQNAISLLQSARIARLDAEKRRESGLIYESTMEAMTSLYAEIERDLRHAFSGDNPLRLFLQPKVNVASGRCDAAEALLRWQHRPGEWVAPQLVTVLIERLGLRQQFNRWLFHHAAQILDRLRDGLPELVLSINLSISDLCDLEVPELLAQALATWQVSARSLCVEITETQMLEQGEESVADVLGQLRALGVRLAIDDFGTGFSGMSRLKQMAVQEVKIDRSFVTDLLTCSQDREIITSIIELSHRLGISVTAEGVEDGSTAEGLAALGCDYFQGYFYSPALPVDDFLAWVDAFHGLEDQRLSAPLPKWPRSIAGVHGLL